MKTTTFKDLRVWQDSRVLAKQVYVLSGQLPKEELYGIGSQIKRCSISIPSNIAEGYRRRNYKEFLQFLGIASGSAAELETQLILVTDIFGLNTDEEQVTLLGVQKMLTVLQKTIEKNHTP